MSSIDALYEIRGYQPETDKGFIMATFLRGLYYGDSWFSQIPKHVFMDNYKRFLEALLQSPKVVVNVACLKEDSEVILGYSILSADYSTIHWVFVKQGDKELSWRKQGIAKRLLPQYPTAVTHLTALGLRLLPKFENCIFNPFAI